MRETRRIPHRPRLRTLGVAAAAVAALLVLPGGVAASERPDDGDRGHRRCERRFDEAQRIDMESFRDYDRETWRDLHVDDAITIFASGTVIEGRDAIVDALAGHFDDREAVWSWTETSRRVEGCRTAFILYETVYEIPSIGFRLHARTGVTYTYQAGHWLVVADQGTPLP